MIASDVLSSTARNSASDSASARVATTSSVTSCAVTTSLSPNGLAAISKAPLTPLSSNEGTRMALGSPVRKGSM